MLNEIVDLFRSANTNHWYGKLALVGTYAVGIYVVVIDQPLKIAIACAVSIIELN